MVRGLSTNQNEHNIRKTTLKISNENIARIVKEILEGTFVVKTGSNY